MPETRNYTAVRNNLREGLDWVQHSRAPILINRRAGGNTVLISEAECNSMAETLYLFSTRAKTRALMQSIDQLDDGEVVIVDWERREAAEGRSSFERLPGLDTIGG